MKIIKRSIFLLLFILSTTINCFSQHNYWLISWFGSSPEKIIEMIYDEENYNLNKEMYDVKKEKITFIYGGEMLMKKVTCYFKNEILYKVECDNRMVGKHSFKKGQITPYHLKGANIDIENWEAKFYTLADYTVYKWKNIDRIFTRTISGDKARYKKRGETIPKVVKSAWNNGEGYFWLDKNGKTPFDFDQEGLIGSSRFLNKPGIEVEILKAESFYKTVITAQ